MAWALGESDKEHFAWLYREDIDVAKKLVNEAIAEKLYIGALVSSNTFCSADLGCSVGPNTFIAVENIIEAVKLKYQSQSPASKIPEFQVFFNDHTSNDFNFLFTSLPKDREYYAAGLPGSFHCRIFPEVSLHIVHASSSIHWLSRVPKEVMNKNSPAWNGGRIHYTNSGDEVIRAYKAQYDEDTDRFLQARAHEVVLGGLMLLIFSSIPKGTLHSQPLGNIFFNLLGSCLMDVAKKGIICEEKVDSFNIPYYVPTPEEFQAAVERNGCFSIERKENARGVFVSKNLPNAHIFASHLRAGMEGRLKQHFGGDITDELFNLYHKKVEEMVPFMLESGKRMDLFVVLKRKADISPLVP
ncbi:loganic acid O-methyltransferase-like [Ziziphus jujuba]|uniref:Loganic acid O-methyltransferase-like n=1 Tax=Ziziphus jujuba TaxID=326968 RepID=A0ABM3IKV5_ZIZJJ|nr:loganic acid O-methyltransferase-like [Ziziphus jujuba]